MRVFGYDYMMVASMINEEAMQRIEELNKEYERRWGKPVDYLIKPASLTQESLVIVLERIVDTGESILVGWNKIKKK